jgi:NitT/TauT family transport system permease protein
MSAVQESTESTGTATPAAPSPAPGPRGLARVPTWVWSALLAIAIVALGEVSARNEWVSRFILPAPSDVWGALISGFETGVYWRHIRSTVGATTAGFAISAVASIVISGILAGSPRLERVFLPFIVAFQTMPKIAIAPLIILWLGFGATSKTAVVAAVCFFPILVNTLQGLKIRDRDKLELLKSLGASRYQLFRYLRAPAALPYIFAGLHVGIIFALVGAVVAEFVGSQAGLGYFLIQQQVAFNVPGVFATLVLLMIVGLAFHVLVKGTERRVTFWAQDVSGAEA